MLKMVNSNSTNILKTQIFPLQTPNVFQIVLQNKNYVNIKLIEITNRE